MTFHFAPLQGYTDNIYQAERAKWYDPLDFCYTPFIRMEKGEPKRQDLERLSQAANSIRGLIPQIIFRDAEEFSTLANATKALGFSHIDLNLGCPHPMQTGKGRGAAMIANLGVMEEVCGLIKADGQTSYSIKMRLGKKDSNEWRRLMPLLNDTPLAHVTLHPRTATQMYKGEIQHSQAAEFFALLRHPAIYNGDILTPSDIDRAIALYPGISGIMIGRGLLACPSLVEEWKQGREWSHEERMANLLPFMQRLSEAYGNRLCGDSQILQKLKPYWQSLESEIGHKATKAISKATTLPRYRAAVLSLEELPPRNAIATNAKISGKN